MCSVVRWAAWMVVVRVEQSAAELVVLTAGWKVAHLVGSLVAPTECE